MISNYWIAVNDNLNKIRPYSAKMNVVFLTPVAVAKSNEGLRIALLFGDKGVYVGMETFSD